MSADAYGMLASHYMSALERFVAPILGDDLELFASSGEYGEIFAEVQDHLRAGNSLAGRMRWECGCATLWQSFVAHGRIVTVRFHTLDCPTGLGCDCGCYSNLDKQLSAPVLMNETDGALSALSVELVDGIPEVTAPMNRAQRRAARHRRPQQ